MVVILIFWSNINKKHTAFKLEEKWFNFPRLKLIKIDCNLRVYYATLLGSSLFPYFSISLFRFFKLVHLTKEQDKSSDIEQQQTFGDRK